jgi:uncharacterized protein YeaO (DUF488 family)
VTEIKTKRVYLPAEDSDGARVLADRLWPRGITKERAALTEWARDAAPSADIRKKYSHQPDRFETFKADYTAELDGESKMFCFQCEQTAGCTGCTGAPASAAKGATARCRMQADRRAHRPGARLRRRGPDREHLQALIEGLFTTITNVNFDDETITDMIARVHRKRTRSRPGCCGCGSPCGRSDDYDMEQLWKATRTCARSSP